MVYIDYRFCSVRNFQIVLADSFEMGFIFSKNETATLEPTNDKSNAIQVNPWDSSAVKNAIDDAAKQIALDKLKFEEVFKLMNIRLFIRLVD